MFYHLKLTEDRVLYHSGGHVGGVDPREDGDKSDEQPYSPGKEYHDCSSPPSGLVLQ